MDGKREFENTFAPACKNRTLTVDAIITGLQCSAFNLKKLPKEIRDAVHEEMERRDANAKEGGQRHQNPRERRMLYLLGTGLEVRQ